jgi:hypothetical protein
MSMYKIKKETNMQLEAAYDKTVLTGGENQHTTQNNIKKDANKKD